MHTGGGAGRFAGRARFGQGGGGGDAEELEDELLDEEEELLEDGGQDNGRGGGGGGGQDGRDPGRGNLDSQSACSSFFGKQGSFLTRLYR